jgi:hypothetical protein
MTPDPLLTIHSIGTGAWENADAMASVTKMSNEFLCLWTNSLKPAASIHENIEGLIDSLQGT